MTANVTDTQRHGDIGPTHCEGSGAIVSEQAVSPVRHGVPTGRLAHAAVAVGLAATLMLAWFLTPDPRGVGTHEQLLLLPCNFYRLTELPCPFCGMTTAFAHMAHGQAVEALLVQPMGAAGFVVCLLALMVVTGAAVAGKDALSHFSRLLWNTRISWAIGALLAASWIFKIAVTLMS
jgi:hypothetical protein